MCYNTLDANIYSIRKVFLMIVMHIDINSAFLSWAAAYEKQMGIERDIREWLWLLVVTKRIDMELY